MKTNNLFTYMTLPPLPNQLELAEYTAEPADIVLWHHRLAHTGYSTLENMKRLKTAIGFHPNLYHGSIPQCANLLILKPGLMPRSIPMPRFQPLSSYPFYSSLMFCRSQVPIPVIAKHLIPPRFLPTLWSQLKH